MSRSGKVNPVSILLILALIGGGWWGYTYFPVYWDNLTVREAVDSAATVYLASEEEGVKGKLMQRLNMLTTAGEPVGWHFEIDEDGYEVRVPGLGVTEDDITVEWDEANRTVTVQLEYDRVVELKPLDERRTVHFSVVKKLTLK